jgi:hypothetical protein
MSIWRGTLGDGGGCARVAGVVDTVIKNIIINIIKVTCITLYINFE